ncbi:GPO family capsid scaffolding protein [Comamonas sp. Y33R10-2]|uniref:GPO family capsid scaffolding protein n=1 Tax=Comamonas sp. Y33R10-2 TaxID=2853257 RepID=UPI001C5CA640|nr:GPO family capsid scaffolding protein [Comamonas sp. Y33R10-2]QXZ10283.1 GPO family capsid scaffolding protein [Comamonas sp. Y33R10-2]
MSKSKWFRVATEGATTDGRSIQRTWIEQMAKNFSPAKYGARVWIEHMRGMLPDSAFAAQGDVLAIKAEAVEDGKLALFAQIKPLETLVAMNQKGQKIYTSIEVDPEFAGTGEAYLVGIAVTDSPASLGTELLQFSSQHPDANPLKARKISPQNLFTAAQEFKLELEPELTPSAEAGVLAAALGKFTAFLEKLSPGGNEKPATTTAPAIQQHSAAPAADINAALAEAGKALHSLSAQQIKDTQTIAELKHSFSELKQSHDALVQKLSAQTDGTTRPAATGGDGYAKADY